MAVFSSGNNRGRDAGGNGHAAGAQAQPMAGKRGMFSVLGADVTITGNVVADADLHVDGRIEGDVDCGNLVQGTESRIKGAVKADTARIAGTVEGSVAVRTLTVDRSAQITGDVEYETISIENGASIDGRLKHLAADAGKRSFDRPGSPAPEISLVSSNASGSAA